MERPESAASFPAPSGVPLNRPRPQVQGWDLLRCIGRGSYGEVWIARDPAGRFSAVKVVYRSTFQNDRPFERELSGIERFEPISHAHPSQVAISHVGKNLDQGYFYYVMELADDASRPAGLASSGSDPPALPGTPGIDHATYAPRTLRSELSERGRLPFRECLEIGRALATALEHLHRHGLIHRDIKPSNVIFVGGVPKLADIGLVTGVDASISFVGTEGFLPPEGPGTPQADIYSLGKVLYEISTGRDRLEFPELPTFPDELRDRDELLELNLIFLKACQNDVTRRYQSAREMSDDLLLLRDGKSVRQAQARARRLARWRFAAMVAGLATIVILATAHFVQERRLQRIELEKVNEERIAREARSLAHDQSRRFADLLVANGRSSTNRGDFITGLLYFTQALQADPPDPGRQSQHHARIESLLQQCPPAPLILAQDGGFHSAEFSITGHRLLLAGPGDSVRVWNVAGGTLVGTPLKHSAAVQTARLEPDGDRVLTVTLDGQARLWAGLDSPSPMEWPLAQSAPIRVALFSPDGKRIFTGGTGTNAALWETSSRQVRFQLSHPSGVAHAAFAPGGARLATVDRKHALRLWNADEGTQVGPETRLPDEVIALAFSPDGRRVLAACGGEARLWDAARLEPATYRLKHEGPMTCSVFSPDGRRVVTGDVKGLARVWDAVTGRSLVTLAHRDAIERLVFSPDGRVLAVLAGSEVTLWKTGSDERKLPVLVHPGIVQAACFSPDGSRLLTGDALGAGRMFHWNSRADISSAQALMTNAPLLEAWIGVLSGRRLSSGEELNGVDLPTLLDWQAALSPAWSNRHLNLDLLAWHRTSAQAGEADSNWFAALFHWRRAAALQPGSESLDAARARQAALALSRDDAANARPAGTASVVPSRPPLADRRLVDLTAHYNAALGETWLPVAAGGAGMGNDLSSLTPGLHRFNGIEFDARGVVQLRGQALENMGGSFPTAIQGIAVKQRCRRLHFLHGAAWSSLAGTHIGTYTVRYADGESRSIKILFGHDVREWWAVTTQKPLTAGAAIAWEGSNEASRALGMGLRLYQMAWRNPLPDAEIVEVDFSSTVQQTAPFLIAITAE